MRKIKIKQTIRNKLLFKLFIIIIISITLGLLYPAILSSTDRKIISKSLISFFNSLDKLDYFLAFKNCFLSISWTKYLIYQKFLK